MRPALPYRVQRLWLAQSLSTLLLLVPSLWAAGPGDLDESFRPAARNHGVVTSLYSDGSGGFLAIGGFTCTDPLGCHVSHLRADGTLQSAFRLAINSTDLLDLVVKDTAGRFVATTYDMTKGDWRLQRFLAEGSRDATFPVLVLNQQAQHVGFQPTGKLLVAGDFDAIDGRPCNGLVRLSLDGSVDSAYQSPFKGSDIVALLPDGRAIVQSGLSLPPGYQVQRLDTEGQVDPTFNQQLKLDSSATRAALFPDGSLLLVGSFSRVEGVGAYNRLVKLSSLGIVDRNFNAGSGPDFDVELALPLSSGKVLLGGNFREVDDTWTPFLARLNWNGSVDDTFNVGDGPDGAVYAGTVSGGGPTVIGGAFTVVDGHFHRALALLAPDGSVQPDWQPQLEGQPNVQSVVRLESGAVLIRGSFSSLEELYRPGLATARPDGSIDAAFRPSLPDACLSLSSNLVGDSESRVLAVVHATSDGCREGWARAEPRLVRLGRDGAIDGSFGPLPLRWEQGPYRVAVHGDGTIAVGNGRGYLIRVRPDGSLDESFVPGSSWSGLDAIRPLADGTMLVAASSGQSRQIIRFRPDGAADSRFVVPYSGSIAQMEEQPDGRILVAGSFELLGGVSRRHIARLRADASVDLTFGSSVGTNHDSGVAAMAIQDDGRVVVGGAFSEVFGIPRPLLARLDQNGMVDPSFRPQMEGSSVTSLALQPDGGLLVAGSFTSVGGTPRPGLARLYTTAPAEPGCEFAVQPTTVAAPSAGVAAVLTVSASGAGCLWTATSNSSWIGFSGPSSGTGSGAVNLTVAANFGPARVGTVAVAGVIVTVAQEAGVTTCSFAVSPSTQQATAGGGQVAFTVQPNPSSCRWSATAASPWLTVTNPSTGLGASTVRVAVGANPGPARIGSLWIGGAPVIVNQAGGGGSSLPYAAWLPVAINAPGQSGSYWRTDMGLLNLGTSEVSGELGLQLLGGVTVPFSVQPGVQLLFRDVVGQSLHTAGKAPIQVRSSGPILVNSKTYNDSPAGTYGQDYEGFSPSDALQSGDSGWLLQLSQKPPFRTNLGLTNSGVALAEVSVDLFRADGQRLVEFRVTLRPGQFWQEEAFRTRAGSTEVESGYARIRVESGGGIWAHASVIDGRTNDPTTVRMQRF